MPVSASDKGSSAQGSVEHQPASAEPSADISYCSFYREQPQPEPTGSAVGDSAAMAVQPSSRAVSRAPESGQLSGDHAADPAGEKATALLTAAADSLSAPTKATHHPDASPTTAGGPQQESFMDEETGQCLESEISAPSRAQEALKALSGTGRSSARLQALTHISWYLPYPRGGTVSDLSARPEQNMCMQVQLNSSNPWQRHSHLWAQTRHLLQGRRMHPRDLPGSALAGGPPSRPQSAPDMAPTQPKTREASLGQARADGQLRRRTPVPEAGQCPGRPLSAPDLHRVVVTVAT